MCTHPPRRTPQETVRPVVRLPPHAKLTRNVIAICLWRRGAIREPYGRLKLLPRARICRPRATVRSPATRTNGSTSFSSPRATPAGRRGQLRAPAPRAPRPAHRVQPAGHVQNHRRQTGRSAWVGVRIRWPRQASRRTTSSREVRLESSNGFEVANCPHCGEPAGFHRRGHRDCRDAFHRARRDPTTTGSVSCAMRRPRCRRPSGPATAGSPTT